MKEDHVVKVLIDRQTKEGRPTMDWNNTNKDTLNYCRLNDGIALDRKK